MASMNGIQLSGPGRHGLRTDLLVPEQKVVLYPGSPA